MTRTGIPDWRTMTALLLLAFAAVSSSADDGHVARTEAGESRGVAPLVSASLRGKWALQDGMTAIRFDLELLNDLGLHLKRIEQTAKPVHTHYLGFTIKPSANLEFVAPGGALEAVRSASIPHEGGFALGLGNEEVSVHNFVIRRNDKVERLELLGANNEVMFTLSGAHTYRDAVTGEFFVMEMDLELGASLAGRLGTPRFTGIVVGSVDMTAHVEAMTSDATMEPEAGECIADFGDYTVDVLLVDINGIAQRARVPGDAVALAPSARLRNVGEHDIRWFWTIAPLGTNGPNIGAHPFLAMNYFRLADGVIEQIGQSELKHAWNTVNTGCPCPGGQVMFVGCADNYGISNNGNQFFFGPRDELTAHTGEWQSLGSHFDAMPVDDFRDHGNSPIHPPLEHRLAVAEADLTTPSAQYMIDAWYLVAGDQNIFNSMGYRFTSQTLVGDVWDFAFTGTETIQGPAINAWVDPQSPGPMASNALLDTGTGHLQLAARVTDLGNGQYRYDYALMNLDFDRQVDVFSVPALAGATVTNLYFNDIDDNPANDWQGVAATGRVTFSTAGSNGLDWGTLYNFGFEADIAPAQAGTLLHAMEPGDAAFLALTAMAPVADGSAVDSDKDGIVNTGDNCTLVANADQRDTDGDRFGNVCDPDFNGDMVVNFADLQLMQADFFASGDRDTDLNGDGNVNFADLAIMKSLFFFAPGPSGIE